MERISPIIVLGVGAAAAYYLFRSETASAMTLPDDSDPNDELTEEEKESTKQSQSQNISKSGGLRRGKASPFNKPWQRCLCVFFAVKFGPDSIVNPDSEWDTGTFGELTEERTKEFQSMNGLVADGVVGKRTNAAMDDFFAQETGNFLDGQAARKQAEKSSCSTIKSLFGASQSVSSFLGL